MDGVRWQVVSAAVSPGPSASSTSGRGPATQRTAAQRTAARCAADVGTAAVRTAARVRQPDAVRSATRVHEPGHHPELAGRRRSALPTVHRSMQGARSISAGLSGTLQGFFWATGAMALPRP